MSLGRLRYNCTATAMWSLLEKHRPTPCAPSTSTAGVNPSSECGYIHLARSSASRFHTYVPTTPEATTAAVAQAQVYAPQVMWSWTGGCGHLFWGVEEWPLPVALSHNTRALILGGDCPLIPQRFQHRAIPSRLRVCMSARVAARPHGKLYIRESEGSDRGFVRVGILEMWVNIHSME